MSTKVSTGNSTTSLLTAGSTFTGSWEYVDDLSVIIAVKTDQDGTYTVQFSPDGTNIDSTLTRYFRTNQIEVPHRFTITRRYFRVLFQNTSSSDQTFLRLQTTLGDYNNLNIPIDNTISQDYDSLSVRPTSFKYEVALGRRQGYELWNKWGYNLDIDVGTEVLASFGGTFTPITTATTLSVVSDSTDDDDGGIGANSIVITGIDANRNKQVETVVLDGTTPVVTTSTWLGINRMQDTAGTAMGNVGNITATAVTGGSVLARMPAGEGVTQQCIFYNYAGYDFLADFLRINAANRGKSALLTFKFWIFDVDNNSKKEVFREDIETATTNDIVVKVDLPFVIPPKAVCWIEVTSNTADIICNGRFSGVAVKRVDS